MIFVLFIFLHLLFSITNHISISMMEPEQQTENADCVENADDEEIVEMKKRVEGMHDSSSLFLANTHSSSHHPNLVRDGE